METAMLVRLLYVSKEIAVQPSNFAKSNLDQFRINNKISEISGVLCSGDGVFLQVLEGERNAVSKLYVTICKNSHSDRILLNT